MEKIVFTNESLQVLADKIKENASGLNSHTTNKSNPHGITIEQLGLGAAGSALGLVKSGGDVTISSGVITVNDDSHNHTIANVDNLQSSLDLKVPTSRTINGKALSSNIALSASDVGASASEHTHSYLPLSGGNLTGVLGIGNKYELSPAYNFTNGCLINICAAKSSTMVTIHITGNSYNSSTAPIDSLFQFYDYGDGTIMNYSGLNLGLSLGAMTAYRYNGRLYAHIKQKADYQTLNFTIITNKSGLIPTVENAAAHTSGYTDLVTITPQNVSMNGHSHNYAGSSSAGGAATSAVKATQDASGNVITSTYATKSELDTTKLTLQNSINGKANSSHTHTIANITNLQTTLDGKAASSHNHAASNITSGTLSSDRLPTVPIAKGGTGATTAAAALTNLGITATATELNYVDGVTSNIQTQLNGKSGTSHTHSYLPLSGGTITGQLDADKIFRNGNTFYNVLEFASTATVDEIVIKTKIPFISGNSMPLVHLKGYAYGESATIEMTVAFYIYNDKFTNMGVVSSCPWKPSVYLSSYTENNTKYVAISFSGSIYYPRFVVDYTDIWSGSNNRDYSSGWTFSNRESGATTSVIPTTDKVTIPYKAIANDINGNATTATTASNVAWSGVTSKPSYYDAKAIKSISRSGTTFTYTCMDGTTGTFTQQDNNTDTKVTNTLATTTKAYITGTTSASTNTGTQVFDTGVYLDTTAGQLTATTFNGTTFSGSGIATVSEVKTYLGI